MAPIIPQSARFCLHKTRYCGIYLAPLDKDVHNFIRREVYVGSSADPIDRLAKHNRPHKGYTATRQPWRLVYVHWLPEKRQAQEMERQIKSKKSRKYLEGLISSEDNTLNHS